MGKRKPKLNLDKPYEKIINNEPDRPDRFPAYRQNGVIFDQAQEPIGEYEVEVDKAERLEREETVKRAEDILGDLGPVLDPQREAAQENAAAAAAEDLSDDA